MNTLIIVFFNSSYWKSYCTSNCFYERKNYVTLFGEITFKRWYYYDKKTNERFLFTDLFLGLPKRKHFEPFASADIVENSTNNSYSKKLVAEKIDKRTFNSINISRAAARNIVINIDIIKVMISAVTIKIIITFFHLSFLFFLFILFIPL